MKNEGIKGLYRGFSLSLCICLPVTILQFALFQNLKFISNQKKSQWVLINY